MGRCIGKPNLTAPLASPVPGTAPAHCGRLAPLDLLIAGSSRRLALARGRRQTLGRRQFTCQFLYFRRTLSKHFPEMFRLVACISSRHPELRENRSNHSHKFFGSIFYRPPNKDKLPDSGTTEPALEERGCRTRRQCRGTMHAHPSTSSIGSPGSQSCLKSCHPRD